MVTLVDERDEHAPAVERLLDVAFGEARWHKTCQRLRDSRSPLRGLSLVALDRDALVGTVRLWPVLAGRRRALLLGPLAVDPAWRAQGVGGQLMEEALRRAAAAAAKGGEENVLLGGDPAYYRRFGFRPDATTGLLLPGPVERPRFLACKLKGEGLKGVEANLLPMAA